MGKRRVLVADDHKIIRGYVRSIFEARGLRSPTQKTALRLWRRLRKYIRTWLCWTFRCL
jgi:hypothetical protein